MTTGTLQIRKIAVLGAGVMGAQIAAHLVNADVETFVNVRNIFDRDPPIVAPNPAGFSYSIASSNPQLYDQLGRTFTVGLRMKF